jgi:hypothetical protein
VKSGSCQGWHHRRQQLRGALAGGLRRAQGLGVAEWFAVQAGGQVGDQGQRQHADAGVARQDGLGHGTHAHRVGAERAQHADLGRCLELRPQHPRVHALVQRLVQAMRHRMRDAAQWRVVGVAQVDETLRARLAVQRRALHHVEVVGHQHQGAGAHRGLQAAGCIGQHQHAHAERGQRADRALHRIRPTVLIGVLAPGQHRHRHAADAAQAQGACMAGHAHLRKCRQLGVRDVHRSRHAVHHAAPARAEHDRHPWRVRPAALRDQRGAGLHVVVERTHFRCSGPKLSGNSSPSV